MTIIKLANGHSFDWRHKSTYHGISDSHDNPNGRAKHKRTSTLKGCLQWCYDLSPNYSCEWRSHHSMSGDNCWAKTASMAQAQRERTWRSWSGEHWYFYDPIGGPAT